MKDELFIFYNKYLKSRKLVFNRILLKYWLAPILFIGSTPGLSMLISNINSLLAIFLLLIVYVVFAIITVATLNKGAKDAIRKQINRELEFDINKDKRHIAEDYWHWDGTALNELKKKILINKFLKPRRITTKEQLNELYDFLSKESERAKYSGFFNLSILLALTVPLWSEFVKYKFTHFSIV